MKKNQRVPQAPAAGTTSLNPWKDPFFRTTFSWAAGIVSVILVVDFAAKQTPDTSQWIIDLIPFFLVGGGSFYLVKFIGRKPAYYCGLNGLLVGIGLALVGLIPELFEGAHWESFYLFALVSFARGIPLLLVGMIFGWFATRGRVPIEIELPGKDELELAKKEGRPEPGPRIVTPVTAMPGSLSANKALLEKLETDPQAIMPEKIKRQQQKAAKSKR